MSEVLVLVDHRSGTLTKSAAELLTIARRLGEPSAVVLGAGAADAQEAVGRYGATTVYTSDAAELDDFLVAPRAEVLAGLVERLAPAALLVSSSPEGREIAARVAVRTGSGVLTDAVDVAADLSVTQSVFAGSWTVVSAVTRGVPVITVKPNATTPEEAPVTPTVERLDVQVSAAARGARVRERTARERTGRPDLTEATVVVAGGRGTGGDFGAVEAFADALGGAVGASRAAVDSGWYPHAYQIGQTGTTVSPQLYVACGISGAIQHSSGMRTSRTVVVVNKDADAPIFAMADLGIVGDLATVLPQATAEIERRRG